MNRDIPYFFPVFLLSITLTSRNNHSTNHIFFYGSLQSPINYPLKPSIKNFIEFIDKGYFYGQLFDLGEYPGAIESNTTKYKVFGEIYRIIEGDDLFYILDEYEDYYPQNIEKSEYVRKVVQVKSNNNDKVQCWIYLYNQSTNQYNLISNGNYLDYRDSRTS